MTPEFEFRAAASGSLRPQGAAANPPANGAPVTPGNAVIGDLATWVRARLPLIEIARKAHNDRVFYANELNDAARRSVLQFDYQVATGAAEVRLVAPASPAPSGGTTSSAAKDDGPPVMPLPVG